jgi:ankyrin repeat protein
LATSSTSGVHLEQVNRQGLTPLMLAVKKRRVETAKLLLAAGASPDRTDANGTPLLHTVISCEPEKRDFLGLLIAAGADVGARDASGRTALHRALYNHLYVRCLEPAEKLLQAGAPVNVLDVNGTAPLFGLDQWDRKDPAPALELLQRFGADVNIRDHQGMTPLLRAARFGVRPRYLQVLLDAGADPLAKDERGNTLLHFVVMNDKPGGVERLRIALPPARVLLETPNRSGRTPLALARKYGYDGIAGELEAAGAR